MKTEIQKTAQFRACAGQSQGLGATPDDALSELMAQVSGETPTPIVIWPYNRGDAFFTDAQQRRLTSLKARRETITADERAELERLIESAFDAATARTQAAQSVKS